MPEEAAFTRPGTVPELVERLESFYSPEGVQALEEFVCRPDDVFVVTPPKSGTTWMQQILHGLRSGGSMDFDNINDVAPWLGMTHTDPQTARDGQAAFHPQVFKSHESLDQVPAGARYVVVLRDPVDVVVSWYWFFAGSHLDPDRLDFDTFARDFFIPWGVVNRHVLAAWPRRADADVAIFCYESMVDDLPATVEAVARFLDLPLDDELRDQVVTQAELAFMKQHESKFDEALFFETTRHRMRLPPVASLSKVAPDRPGVARPVASPELREEIDASWRAQVFPTTGLDTYDDLRAAIEGSTSR